MMQFVFVLSMLLAGAATGCSEEGGSGADGGADSGSDTDTDSDTDSDVHEDWDWESVVIPGNFVGHGTSYQLHATAADDATVCVANWTNGTGGILSFDGAALGTEETGFVCELVFGLDADHLWALGYVDQTFEPLLYSRTGGAWSADTVAGADDSCSFEAIYGDTPDGVTVVGRCGAERLSWVTDGAGAWIAGAAIVPTNDELDTIYGAFSMPDGDVFYGSGLFENAGGTDLGYGAARALWAEGASLGMLTVLEGDAVLTYDGAEWSELFGCPYDLSADEYAICWSSAAPGQAGDLYVGGGRGGAANENVDDWRLNRFADGTVYRILAPCGGDAPRCGVDDLSLSSDGVLFTVASGPQPRLMWHAVPDIGL